MSITLNAMVRAIAGMARRRAQRIAMQDLADLPPALLDDMGIDPLSLAVSRHRLPDHTDLSGSAARYVFKDGFIPYPTPGRV